MSKAHDRLHRGAEARGVGGDLMRGSPEYSGDIVVSPEVGSLRRAGTASDGWYRTLI